MPWFDASRIINQLRPGETEAAVTAILKLMGRPTPAAGAPKNEQHRSMIGQAAMLLLGSRAKPRRVRVKRNHPYLLFCIHRKAHLGRDGRPQHGRC